MHAEKKRKKKSLIIVIITMFEKKTQHFYIGINYTEIKMYTLYFRELIYLNLRLFFIHYIFK